MSILCGTNAESGRESQRSYGIMQEVVTCAIHLDCQVAALSEGVTKRQNEFEEKAQSLSATVSLISLRFALSPLLVVTE